MQDIPAAYYEAVQKELGHLSFLKQVLDYLCIPPDLKEAIAGIAEMSGIPQKVLIGLNVGYNLVTACSSAVALIDSEIEHLRSLDWDMPVLKKLIIKVAFHRSGSPILKMVTFAGFVGAFTAISKDFSVSLN